MNQLFTWMNKISFNIHIMKKKPSQSKSLISILILFCFLFPINSLNGQLQGVYTIGAGGDYTSFSEAVDALNKEGTFGPVTFNVLAGTYTEQFNLGKINGPGELSPVIFQSQVKNYKSVILSFAPSSELDNYIAKIEGSEHIIFRHLTFEMTNYGRAFDLGFGAKDIRIDSCHLQGVYNTNSYEKYALIYSEDGDIENLSITGNRIENCSFGVCLLGEISNDITGTQIIGNSFGSVGYTAIYLTRNSSPTINKNTINSFIYGIYAPGISGATSIQNNQITAGSHGITLRNDGAILGRGRIANNFVLVTGGSEMQGIDIRNSTFTDIYYNTVAIYPKNADSRAFSCAGSIISGSINIMNNSFATMTTGYAYYVGTGAAINESDYNNYYSPSKWLARWNSDTYDLNDLKNMNGKDSHSLSVFPFYNSEDDLHTLTPWLNGKAMPMTSLPEDIDGELRSTSHPDIGADEYDILAMAPMYGNYTVGSGKDYETIQAAVHDLTWRGISAKVFLRLSDPIFNEQVEIVSIPGSSPENTVSLTTPLIMPPGDSIVMRHEALDAENNYVIRLLGADFIEIRNLCLQALGNTYANVILMDGGCDSVSIINNKLSALLTTNNDTRRVLIYSKDGYYLKRNIEGNTFRGGSYGIYMSSISPTKTYPKGTEIRDNEMLGIGYGGVFLQNHIGPQITGNIIKGGYLGIALSQIEGSYLIEKNKLDILGQYGIKFTACSGFVLDPGKVSNNFIHVGGAGNAYGIYTSSSNYQNIYYNSVNITSTDLSDGRAFFCGGGSNILLKNNIFMNQGGGFAYYVSVTSAISGSDYNDFFTIGTKLAYFNELKTDLLSLQSGNSYHDHCISVNPQYVGYNNLHATNEALSGAATPILSISDDIDGDLRHQSTPDIGADEFSGGGSAMFTELVFDTPGFANGNAIWGDYDRDEDLDILVAGSLKTFIYKNSEDHFYQDESLNLLGLSRTQVSWTDFNRDGDLDFLLQGEFEPGTNS